MMMCATCLASLCTYPCTSNPHSDTTSSTFYTRCGNKRPTRHFIHGPPSAPSMPKHGRSTLAGVWRAGAAVAWPHGPTERGAAARGPLQPPVRRLVGAYWGQRRRQRQRQLRRGSLVEERARRRRPRSAPPRRRRPPKPGPRAGTRRPRSTSAFATFSRRPRCLRPRRPRHRERERERGRGRLSALPPPARPVRPARPLPR